MKVIAGVEWSDDAFAAVEQLALLYRPDEVTLAHGVDIGFFEYPIVAEAANLQGYDIFRKAMFDAGCQALDRGSMLLPSDIPPARKLCEFRKPARFVLDAATSINADLIVVGTQGHSRMAEFVLSSVSHRILLHATQPTLIVKGKAKPVARILVAVEGRDDARRIGEWLTAHPFRQPVEATVLTVVPSIPMVELERIGGFEAWSEGLMKQAEATAKSCAESLRPPHFMASSMIRKGEPAAVIAEQAKSFDLLVAGSHGRKGLDRFLLGNVSHAIVHRAPCSVLVIR
ncbi:MAG TPA: universal stress protein [Nitrospiraceae bacterium]|nr:universal stress protein [Nitrospiraceae bacterium]